LTPESSRVRGEGARAPSCREADAKVRTPVLAPRTGTIMAAATSAKRSSRPRTRMGNKMKTKGSPRMQPSIALAAAPLTQPTRCGHCAGASQLFARESAASTRSTISCTPEYGKAPQQRRRSWGAIGLHGSAISSAAAQGTQLRHWAGRLPRLPGFARD